MIDFNYRGVGILCLIGVLLVALMAVILSV